MDTTFATYIVTIAAVLLIYFPVFAVGNVEKMRLQELTLLHPQFAWLKRSYPFILVVLFMPLVILAMYIFFADQAHVGDPFYLLFVPFVSIFSLFHGILAFTTGIYPLWITKNTIRYWYDEGHTKTWIAEVQVALAFALIAMSLFLYFA